jgi:hypothetical protein
MCIASAKYGNVDYRYLSRSIAGEGNHILLRTTLAFEASSLKVSASSRSPKTTWAFGQAALIFFLLLFGSHQYHNVPVWMFLDNTGNRISA